MPETCQCNAVVAEGCRAWLLDAKVSAVRGSCPRSHASFQSGVKNIRFAEVALGVKVNAFPPTLRLAEINDARVEAQSAMLHDARAEAQLAEASDAMMEGQLVKINVARVVAQLAESNKARVETQLAYN